MSTRIYGGVKFTSGDFHEVFAQLQRFRKRLVPLTESMVGEYIGTRITRMVDDTAAKGEPLGDNFLSKAVGEFRDDRDEVKKTGYRNPGVDTEFKVMILPYKGELYGMLFCEQSEWRKLFLSQKWVREFSYTNATDDTPPGISYEEYRKRGPIWDKVMPSGVPIKHGVEADLSYQFYWPEWDWIEPHLAKPFEDRVKETADGRVTHNKMREITSSDLDGGDEDTGKYFSAFWEANRWVKTDEGKAAVAAEADLIRPLLAPELTRFVVDGTIFDVPPKA